MSNNLLNNKRIAKNTLMLYIRMVIMMGVSLFTSRVILQALGVSDFGLYNIVGGVVVLFTFINNAMVASTQRFLNYELGRDNFEEASNVFSASLSIHLIIALIFFLLAESVGLWFLNSYIKIPFGREFAANWVYQFTILASIVNIVRAPYNASIIAHERMSFYAYVSIIEGVLKLLIVYFVYLFSDRLISYSILITIVTMLIFCAYYLYCRKNFVVCKYRFRYNKQRYLSIASFSGWSLLGSVANMGAQQGLNILLNIFFSVTVNAAMGVANQVNNAIYHFVANFQTAFNPQIIKTYAAKKENDFFNLIYNTSRYSFFLLFIMALPVLICCSELISLWLTEEPEYATNFCRIIIINSIFDALSGPLWMSIYASGRIKKYQVVISCLLSFTIILAYLLAQAGYNPIIVLWSKPIVGLIIYLYRLFYCKRKIKLSLTHYWNNVILKCLFVTLISAVLSYLMYTLVGDGFINLLIKVVFSIFITSTCILFIGLTSEEKKYIYLYLKKILYHDELTQNNNKLK